MTPLVDRLVFAVLLLAGLLAVGMILYGWLVVPGTLAVLA